MADSSNRQPGRYAVITPQSGKVVNVIVCRQGDTVPGCSLVASDTAQVGDSYNGTSFVRPVANATPLACGCIDVYRQALYDRIAHIRTVKESMGVQYKGFTFNTDTASQLKYLASSLLAVQDTNYWGMFPTAGGRYVRLVQDDVLQLCAIAATYVNGCLLEEAQLQQRVDVAQSVQDLQAIEQSLPALPT